MPHDDEKEAPNDANLDSASSATVASPGDRNLDEELADFSATERRRPNLHAPTPIAPPIDLCAP